MWGLWHLLSNYLGSESGAAGVPLFIYLPVLLFSFLPPFRILMVWVYRHTESLWLAWFMYASLDVCWMLSMPTAIKGKELVVWYLLWAALLWSLVVIMGVAGRKKKAPTPSL